MSLIDTLQAGVETAFEAAAELVRLGVYTSKSGVPTYNPLTDQMTGGLVGIPNVRMLEVVATAEEREASPVTVSDTAFLIPWVDLPRDPSETDTILLDGVSYNVLTRKKIPGKTIHKVFCRKK